VVDAAVVNGGWSDTVPAPRQFAMTLGRERFVALAGNEELSPPEFALAARGRSVAAVAGIGNPSRFFDHLASLGVAARRIAFDDHHAFQPQELKLPGTEVIVMTEKDAVKCAEIAGALHWYVPVTAVFDAGDGEALQAVVTQSIEKRSARA